MKIKYIICFIIFNFVLSISVFAECDYYELAKVNKDANNLIAGYSFIYDGASNDVTGFEIALYNMTDHMYVKMSKTDILANVRDLNESTNDESFIIPYNLSDSRQLKGYLSIKSFEINKITKYTFEVYSVASYTGCSKQLRVIDVYKPMKNSYYDNALCKHLETKNLYYCQKWLTSYFNKDDEYITSLIKSYLNKSDTLTLSDSHASVSLKDSNDAKKRIRYIYFACIAAFLSLIVILICAIRLDSYNKNTI